MKKPTKGELEKLDGGKIGNVRAPAEKIAGGAVPSAPGRRKAKIEKAKARLPADIGRALRRLSK
jgi:hypothetical protein